MRKSFFFNQRNESLNYQIAFFTYFFDKYIFFLLKMFYWVNAVKYVHVPHTAGFFVTYFLIHETTPRSGYKTFTDPPEASVVPFLVNNPPHKNSHHSDFYLHSLVGLFLNLIKKKKWNFTECTFCVSVLFCSTKYHAAAIITGLLLFSFDTCCVVPHCMASVLLGKDTRTVPLWPWCKYVCHEHSRAHLSRACAFTSLGYKPRSGWPGSQIWHR